MRRRHLGGGGGARAQGCPTHNAARALPFPPPRVAKGNPVSSRAQVAAGPPPPRLFLRGELLTFVFLITVVHAETRMRGPYYTTRIHTSENCNAKEEMGYYPIEIKTFI